MMNIKKFIKILKDSEFRFPLVSKVYLEKKHNKDFNSDNFYIYSEKDFEFSYKRKKFGYKYHITGKAYLKFNAKFNYYSACEIYGYNTNFRKGFREANKKFIPYEKGVSINHFIGVLQSEIINRLNESCDLHYSLFITARNLFQKHSGDFNEKIHPR